MGKNTQLLRLHLLSTVPTSYLSLLKLHRVLDSQSWSLNFTKTWDGNTTGDPLQERLLKWRLRRGWGRWASRSCGGATKAAFSAHAPGFKLAGNMGLYIENACFSINQKMSPGKFAKTQQMRMPTMYHWTPCDPWFRGSSFLQFDFSHHQYPPKVKRIIKDVPAQQRNLNDPQASSQLQIRCRHRHHSCW